MPIVRIISFLGISVIFQASVGCSHEPTASVISPGSLLESLYTLPDPNFMAFHDPSLRRSYFTTEISNLIDAKEACYERVFGMSNLDFDYIVPGQDYILSNLEISPIEQTRDQATFLVQFENFSEKVDLTYNLQRTAFGWRIADTIYDKNHLKDDLASPCETPGN